MCHDTNLWVRNVQPYRYLTVGDDEDVSNPWHMLMDAPQRVQELVVIFESPLRSFSTFVS